MNKQKRAIEGRDMYMCMSWYAQNIFALTSFFILTLTGLLTHTNTNTHTHPCTSSQFWTTNHAKTHLFHVLKLPKRQVVSSHNEWQNEYESGFSAIFCGYTFTQRSVLLLLLLQLLLLLLVVMLFHFTRRI